MSSARVPLVATVPVLVVLVCHDGEQWLRPALSALRRLSPRPRHVLAVDTGSLDRTPELLATADDVLDGVLTLDRATGFGAAVQAALDAGVTRWGDPGQWLWLLHDDCAPEPDCLGVLLTQAEVSPSAAVLGPLALDWADPRLVVEAGLSTDASGHRQTGLGPAEPDWDRFADSGSAHLGPTQSTEVLAVPSAGSLVRRAVWDELGGYDPALALLRDDLDFGWRVNRSGRLVLSVPAARMRHARALSRGLRNASAISGGRPGAPISGKRNASTNGDHSLTVSQPNGDSGAVRAVDRAHGLRTLLVNRGRFAFLTGLPRLTALGLLRALGFVLLRRVADARAELSALGYLLSGRAGLRAGRAARREIGPAGQVRGLLTTRTTRLRNLLRGGLASWVRRRVEADAALGRLPERPAEWTLPEEVVEPPRRPVGPAAVPAGAVRTSRAADRRAAGLRRPAKAVVVPVPAEESAEVAETAAEAAPAPAERPSPVPRGGGLAPPRQELVIVEVGAGQVLRQVLLTPVVLLLLGLTLVSLLTNLGRLGADPSGGGLLGVPDLGSIWSGYLASWHGVAGGTSSSAPAALAILGIFGAIFSPVGGPPAAVAFLLFGDLPLAGLLAYFATRRLPVRREVRGLAAAGYALLPAATAAVANGRLDVVVAHVLLPPVLAGLCAIIRPPHRGNGRTTMLSTAAGTSIGIAVIGAFTPLVHAALVVFALAGFVAIPAAAGFGRRRTAALFAIVLVPLALLLPWPAVILTHPVIMLSGITAPTDQDAGIGQLLSLDPGGAGAWQPAGLALLVAFVAVLVLRPRREMWPAVGLLVLGAAGVAAVFEVPAVPLSGVSEQRFWTGAPMLLVGGGLLWAMVTAAYPARGKPPQPAKQLGKVLAAVGVVALAVLAAGELLAGRTGPLRGSNPDALSQAESAELTQTGRSVLVLGTGSAPTRQRAGGLPGFADDSIAPVAGSPERLDLWDAEFLSQNPTTVRTAVAQAVAAGVLFVELPGPGDLAPLKAAAGDVLSPVAPSSTGRPVVRLQLAGGAAALFSEQLAKLAVSGGTPPTDLGAVGISPVAAMPPNVALRVSEGAANRLLVLAAEDEPGWQATLNGAPAPIVRAWGHLVAVTVPLNGADIRIEQPTSLRDVLLLIQAAAWLFAVLTAIPSRRPR